MKSGRQRCPFFALVARFELFNWTAVFGPRRKPLFQVRRIKAHVLKRRDGQCRAPSACAVKDILLIFLPKDIFEIGALGIDPELDHTPRCMDAARNEAGALPFAYVSNVDNDNRGVI